MNALQRRRIKGRLLDVLQARGIAATVTDSSVICVFTNRKLTEQSKLIKKKWWITSFGPKTAEDFIKANS